MATEDERLAFAEVGASMLVPLATGDELVGLVVMDLGPANGLSKGSIDLDVLSCRELVGALSQTGWDGQGKGPIGSLTLMDRTLSSHRRRASWGRLWEVSLMT